MGVDEAFPQYLRQLGRVFDLDGFLKEDVGPEAVRDYYTRTAWVYGLLHSREGAIHLALNYDGRYDARGFEEQIRLIEEQWEQQCAASAAAPHDALEIGCGKGYNSRRLARAHPDARFTGIDLTPVNVAIARRSGKELRNAAFAVGDYEDLPFGDGAFDFAIAIECLCHARRLPQALSEIRRVLRPGGRFVVTDGFREPDFGAHTPSAQLAAQLLELSMTVARFWQIDHFVDTASGVGLRVLEVRDLSVAILPNLQRLQRVAKAYFRYPEVTRALTRTLPPHLVRHAVTGLLGAATLQAELQGYYAVVLERPR